MEISAVTSLSGMPSLSQVTRALGKELISALNSRTSSSSADSYSLNSGKMDINSPAVSKEERHSLVPRGKREIYEIMSRVFTLSKKKQTKKLSYQKHE